MIDSPSFKGPNIRVPPLYFIGGFLLGLIAHAYKPIPLSPNGPTFYETRGGWYRRCDWTDRRSHRVVDVRLPERRGFHFHRRRSW